MVFTIEKKNEMLTFYCHILYKPMEDACRLKQTKIPVALWQVSSLP